MLQPALRQGSAVGRAQTGNEKAAPTPKSLQDARHQADKGRIGKKMASAY